MKIQLVIDKATINEFQNIIKEVVENTMKKYPHKIDKKNNLGNEEELLTRKEVMKLLDISHATLFNYQKRGTLPFLKIGNRVYFKKSDIMDNEELIGCGLFYKSD